MSKEYICKQIKDGEICGETNVDKFIKGRYSTCIECKNKYLQEYRKKAIAAKELEMNMTIVERINQNKGDLGKNIHDMMTDMYWTYPIKDIGIALPVKLKEYEDEMKNFISKASNIMQGMEKKLEHLIKENTKLKEENIKIKENKEDLKNSLEQLNEKYGTLLLKYDTNI
jgi:uncharacterized protein YaaN involved in tellurite resistance